MSYNEELNSNNTELNEILSAINELPTAEEGGGSGSGGGSSIYVHNITVDAFYVDTTLKLYFTLINKKSEEITDYDTLYNAICEMGEQEISATGYYQVSGGSCGSMISIGYAPEYGSIWLRFLYSDWQDNSIFDSNWSCTIYDGITVL